jgi:hypothetical protein
MTPKVQKQQNPVLSSLPLEFFKTIIKVFDPNAYEELSKRTFRKATAYIFSILFVAVFIMVLFSTPRIARVNKTIGQQLSRIDEFSIDLNVSLREPIQISRPPITMDIENNLTPHQEALLITEHYLYIRYPFCLFDDGRCYQTLNLDEYANLADKTHELASILTAFAIYMLPMLLLTILAIQLITYALWGLAFTLGGIILLKLINRRLLARRLLKIAIYALTPMILLQTINNAFGYELYGIPLMISFFYFIVATLITSEKGFRT